ncbi:MAG: YfjI family protein [Citrobacter sp.]
MSIPMPFPIEEFPKLMRNTAYEVQNITKAPMALIGSAILGVVSLASQNKLDVQRPGGLRGPVSLFLSVKADSGERKSAVDKLISEGLRECEAHFYQQYTQELMFYNSSCEIFVAEKKALLSKMKQEIKHGKDISNTKEKLNELQLKTPILPVRRRLIMSDTTPAALKDHLSGVGKSVGIMSDEGGIIFGGSALNELPLINKLWDGTTISVDRKNKPEIQISEARTSISVQIQSALFDEFANVKGNIARHSGFFSRCLICQPESTQGHRQISNPVVSKEHLPVFNNRIKELIIEDVDSNHRILLPFTPEAEKMWIDYYNFNETEMRASGEFSGFRDYASKISENAARIAALLHFFSGDEGDISCRAMEAAEKISMWYTEQFQILFSKNPALEDENKMLEWISNYCSENNVCRVKKNIILQYGPVRFRSKTVANDILSTLCVQRRIHLEKRANTTYISLSNFGSWGL